eukprot:TRINITY_DN4407_c0_g1_i2.p1 TRINITY_DN4407_c0_g1~~TRINITY_DN4407_c0_g1_i2.p1  ORF type:complete len:283 (-),score=41.61 TRINITY_DN4407_c0_g1_i2:69-917(-)
MEAMMSPFTKMRKAKQYLIEGMQLEKDQQFESALVAFRDASSLVPHEKLLSKIRILEMELESCGEDFTKDAGHHHIPYTQGSPPKQLFTSPPRLKIEPSQSKATSKPTKFNIRSTSQKKSESSASARKALSDISNIQSLPTPSSNTIRCVEEKTGSKEKKIERTKLLNQKISPKVQRKHQDVFDFPEESPIPQKTRMIRQPSNNSLLGTIFFISGKFSRPQNVIQFFIEREGGVVSRKLDQSVTHVLFSGSKDSTIFRIATQMEVHIVDEMFLKEIFACSAR